MSSTKIEKVKVTGHALTIEQVVAVARSHAKVEIDAAAFEKLEAMRRGLEACIARGDVIYGVNTGCGSRKTTVLSADELSDYQMSYIPAHCCGHGEPLPEEVVRAAMLIRLNSFLRGNSGLRPVISERLRDFLNLGLTPVVPRYGSVGASGDLVPLAHMTAALIGLPNGRVTIASADGESQELDSAQGLKLFQLEPIILQAKEAMGMTNGANFIAGIGCLAVHDGWQLFEQANLALSLSLEAIRGEVNAFDARLHEARPLPGQIDMAADVREFTKGSQRMTEAARLVSLRNERPTFGTDGKKVPRVQDAYSFRCAPQIHASAYHALTHAEEILAEEINSSTDNPLIFKDGETYQTLSGGNFHGQPLATVLEYVTIALAPLAGASDRRFFTLLDPKSSFGLPADLAGPKPGNTGLMILQYAGASLVNQIGQRCNPCSVHSVPTSANQEDWVSMGMNSALNLRETLPMIRWVLAAELLAAAQGIRLIEPQMSTTDFSLGHGTDIAYQIIKSTFFTERGDDPETWFSDYPPNEAADRLSRKLEDGSLLKVVHAALDD